MSSVKRFGMLDFFFKFDQHSRLVVRYCPGLVRKLIRLSSCVLRSKACRNRRVLEISKSFVFSQAQGLVLNSPVQGRLDTSIVCSSLGDLSWELQSFRSFSLSSPLDLYPPEVIVCKTVGPFSPSSSAPVDIQKKGRNFS